VGAGVVSEHLGVVSTGTAEVLAAALESPPLTRRCSTVTTHVTITRRRNVFHLALNHIGGILLKWYRDNFGVLEVGEARVRGVDPYQLIDARMPAGPRR